MGGKDGSACPGKGKEGRGGEEKGGKAEVRAPYQGSVMYQVHGVHAS